MAFPRAMRNSMGLAATMAPTIIPTIVLLGVLSVSPARAELYHPALAPHEDTRTQGLFEGFQTVLGMPFLGVRAVLALGGAGAAELGNGALWAFDRPLPGTFPHAEPGWIWRGALRSVRADWNESTPGLAGAKASRTATAE